jgi:hypothetical protein
VEHHLHAVAQYAAGTAAKEYSYQLSSHRLSGVGFGCKGSEDKGISVNHSPKFHKAILYWRK